MSSDTIHTIKTIIISGRSGSGKSRTAYEAAHILLQRKIMHINIEADNLDTMYPRSNDSNLMLMNLKAILTNYWRRVCLEWTDRNAETPFVVLVSGTATVMEIERIESIIRETVSFESQSINLSNVGIQMFPILLQAGETTVTQRLTAREIGGELAEHLTSTRKMGVVLGEWSLQQDRGVSRVLSEGRDVHEVAVECLEVAGIKAKE